MTPPYLATLLNVLALELEQVDDVGRHAAHVVAKLTPINDNICRNDKIDNNDESPTCRLDSCPPCRDMLCR